MTRSVLLRYLLTRGTNNPIGNVILQWLIFGPVIVDALRHSASDSNRLAPRTCKGNHSHSILFVRLPSCGNWPMTHAFLYLTCPEDVDRFDASQLTAPVTDCCAIVADIVADPCLGWPEPPVSTPECCRELFALGPRTKSC